MLFSLFVQRFLGLPFWWYGSGLRATGQYFLQAVFSTVKNFALDVWIKNLFNPMYGDTSFIGRLISFGIRLVMIFFRGLAVVVYTIVFLIVFVAYLLLPPVVVMGILYSLGII